MLIGALILVSVAFAISLYMLMFPSRPPMTHGGASVTTFGGASAALEAETKARQQAESDAEKKRRELEDLRGQLNEVKADLKATKRKVYDQKEAGKGDQDLVKARVDVERNASIQLDAVRGELSTALLELAKLRGEQSMPRRRPVGATALVDANAQPLELPIPTAPLPAPVTLSAPVAPVERERPQRVIRELSESDKEKIDRAEHQANKDRARAAELDKEVRRLKGRNETQHRIFTVTKSELDLVKDKFKALEKRLNRTLLERDLVRRAIVDLTRQTGAAVQRTELTPDEISASDSGVEDRQRLEAAEMERRAQVAKSEAAPAESSPASAESPADVKH